MVDCGVKLAEKHYDACAPAGASLKEDVTGDFGLDVKHKAISVSSTWLEQICRSTPTNCSNRRT
jgi:hypothetical protein